MPGFVFSYCDIPVPLIISALGIATTIRITIRPLDRDWLAEFNLLIEACRTCLFGRSAVSRGNVTQTWRHQLLRHVNSKLTQNLGYGGLPMSKKLWGMLLLSISAFLEGHTGIFFWRWTNTRTFGASQQNFGRLDNTSQWWPNSEKRIQELTNSAMPGECRYRRSYRMHSMLRLGCCPRFHSKYSQIMLERTSIAPWNGKWEFS